MHSKLYFFPLRLSILTTALVLMTACTGSTKRLSEADTIALAPAPAFMADSAMAYVEAQCAFGPRVPGSKAHEACGDWIVQQFKALGAEVSELRTTLNGYDGQPLPCRNLQARMNPEATDRILITAHWDSRAWADNDPDPQNHRTPVMAANDGASGVAVMLDPTPVFLPRESQGRGSRVGCRLWGRTESDRTEAT